MLYRPCPDMDPPTDVDLDDPPMVQMAIAVERGEQDLRLLSRLAEIAMELAEAQGVYAKIRLIAAGADGASLAPHEDPTAAFNKIAQTLRRILALRAKLAHDFGVDHLRLIGERDSRRAARAQAHKKAKRIDIEAGFRDALAEDFADEDQEEVESYIGDMEELFDRDELHGYIDRPVGETVARLCKTLGLSPDLCIQDAGGWKIRRDPYPFEEANPPPNPSPPGATGFTDLDDDPQTTSPDWEKKGPAPLGVGR